MFWLRIIWERNMYRNKRMERKGKEMKWKEGKDSNVKKKEEIKTSRKGNDAENQEKGRQRQKENTAWK